MRYVLRSERTKHELIIAFDARAAERALWSPERPICEHGSVERHRRRRVGDGCERAIEGPKSDAGDRVVAVVHGGKGTRRDVLLVTALGGGLRVVLKDIDSDVLRLSSHCDDE